MHVDAEILEIIALLLNSMAAVWYLQRTQSKHANASSERYNL